MAEGQGFEPWRTLLTCWFSRPVHSTTLPSLRRVVAQNPRCFGQSQESLEKNEKVANDFRHPLRLQPQNAKFASAGDHSLILLIGDFCTPTTMSLFG